MLIFKNLFYFYLLRLFIDLWIGQISFWERKKTVYFFTGSNWAQESEVYKTIGSPGAVFSVQEVVPGLQEISLGRDQSGEWVPGGPVHSVLANAHLRCLLKRLPPRNARVRVAPYSLPSRSRSAASHWVSLGNGVSRFPVQCTKSSRNVAETQRQSCWLIHIQAGWSPVWMSSFAAL